ncbi:MAG: class I adenylate-forming enzyme family protein, partial [Aestuariivirgaceae bacterium]
KATGLVPIPASAMLSPSEGATLLQDSGARLLVSDGTLAVPELGDTVDLLDASGIEALKAHAPTTYTDTHKDDPAYLIYTSGTSGTPKGVLHAQRAIWGRRPMYQGWYGITADDVMLHTGAFNWTYTLGTGLSDPWATGATTLLYTGPRDIEVWPKLIARYGATIMASVPTLYRQMLKYCDLAPGNLAPLRHVLCAGEVLSSALHEQWLNTTSLEIYEALGMSEISTYISSSPSVPVLIGSPGKPQPGRCVVILPADDGSTTPMPSDEVGLIAVHRSDPGLMLGYWLRPQEEAEVFRGDWFIGGDLASMDEDGYIHFKGRNDDLMNAFGYRVSPQEVENALAGHKDVAEVAVGEIDVRDEVSIIAAFVVPAEAADPIPADILAHAQQSLADYKMPRAIHFVDHLPRTGNGKVIRKRLSTLL